MKLFITLFLTTLIAAAATTAADPSTLPTTTQATTAPVVRSYEEALHGMSHDYLVLTNRSIFMKGMQTVDPFFKPAPPPPPPPGLFTEQESTMEFNGATRADQNRAAFFENTATHEYLIRPAGESIAHGKILAITLDSIDYELNGRTSTIMLGQTLDGSDGPIMAGAPSLSMAATQPVGTFTGPQAAMLEQLRQKRLKELGQ
jgi:hypothetical protein